MNESSTTVLIVEDDAFKLDRINACLRQLPFRPAVSIAQSVQAAVAMVSQARFEFILLDMSLPSHDLKPGSGAGTSLLSGGLEIMMELSYLKRPDRVIIITQYPEIEIEGELVSIGNVHAVLREMCEVNIGKVILYRQELDGWEKELVQALER